jgi:hypothetical protein
VDVYRLYSNDCCSYERIRESSGPSFEEEEEEQQEQEQGEKWRLLEVCRCYLN